MAAAPAAAAITAPPSKEPATKEACVYKHVFDVTKPSRGMQADVFSLTGDCDEILIGGPRGVGASWTTIVWAAEPATVRGYVGVLLAQSRSGLDCLVDHAWKIYSKIGAVKKGYYTSFHFPSGAVIHTGHLGTSTAFEQHRGQDYDRISIDNGEGVPSEELFAQLLCSNRNRGKTIKPQTLIAAHIGGCGDEWVHARYIQNRPVRKSFPMWPNSKRNGIYIPGRHIENPYLSPEKS